MIKYTNGKIINRMSIFKEILLFEEKNSETFVKETYPRIVDELEELDMGMKDFYAAALKNFFEGYIEYRVESMNKLNELDYLEDADGNGVVDILEDIDSFEWVYESYFKWMASSYKKVLKRLKTDSEKENVPEFLKDLGYLAFASRSLLLYLPISFETTIKQMFLIEIPGLIDLENDSLMNLIKKTVETFTPNIYSFTELPLDQNSLKDMFNTDAIGSIIASLFKPHLINIKIKK